MPSRHAFDPRWLAAHLKSLLPDVPRPRYCVAFSGGLDSTVLLAALASVRAPAFELRAVHVDHGLQPEASRWRTHCGRFARSLAIPVELRRVQVTRRRGQSLEAQARRARYAALAHSLRSGEVLLTAQHLDDQLETVLLQLLRGAGVAGLAAMPAVTGFANGLHARPLLAVPRAALLGWAQSRSLQWIEDPSNADTGFDRNFLRERVLPVLRARWPGAAGAVARSARHAGAAQALLDHLGRQDVERAADGDGLDVRSLRSLPAARRCNALRYWLSHQGVEAPGTLRLEEIAGPLLAARQDANPHVAWGEVLLLREQGALRLRHRSVPAAAPLEPQTWQPARRRRLQLPHGLLEWRPDARGPLDLGALPGGLRVVTRQGNQSAALKRILQAARVPASEREQLPLLYDGSRLLAVADRWLHPSLRASGGSARRGRLRWTPARRARIEPAK